MGIQDIIYKYRLIGFMDYKLGDFVFFYRNDPNTKSRKDRIYYDVDIFNMSGSMLYKNVEKVYILDVSSTVHRIVISYDNSSKIDGYCVVGNYVVNLGDLLRSYGNSKIVNFGSNKYGFTFMIYTEGYNAKDLYVVDIYGNMYKYGEVTVQEFRNTSYKILTSSGMVNIRIEKSGIVEKYYPDFNRDEKDLIESLNRICMTGNDWVIREIIS